MTTSSTKGGRKYRLTWYTLTLISWGVAVESAVIWVVAGIGSPVDLWLAVVQLIIIVGIAFGALFLAAYQMSEGEHSKKSRVLIAVFLLFIFVILPSWAFMLPDDGTIVYGYWKFMGTILIASFGFMFMAAFVQKYATRHKVVNQFFQLIDLIDSTPLWVKYVIAGIFTLITMYIVLAPGDLVTKILTVLGLSPLIVGLIKKILFNKPMWLRNSKEKKEILNVIDGKITRTQLLNGLNDLTVALNNMTAVLKNITAIVEHMDDDFDKTGAK